MKIKLCIFDMDGLMIDSERRYYESVLKCNEIYNYNIPKDLIKKVMGTNEEETKRLFLEKMGNDFPVDEFLTNEWNLRKEEIKINSIQKKKGIDELLRYLKKNNINMVVATSTKKKYAYPTLVDMGLYDYFDYIIYGDDINESKPHPQIYLKAIDCFDYDKENILAFEDSNNGILSAYNAGLNVIHIPDIAYVSKDTKNKCYAILNDLLEAINLIEKINY